MKLEGDESVKTNAREGPIHNIGVVFATRGPVEGYGIGAYEQNSVKNFTVTRSWDKPASKTPRMNFWTP